MSLSRHTRNTKKRQYGWYLIWGLQQNRWQQSLNY
jgi:hypothetical protein